MPNQFYSFAVGSNPNVITPTDYNAAGSSWRGSGFSSGVASSAFFNTVLRQATMGMHLIGRLGDRAGLSMLDDGQVDALHANFERALRGRHFNRVAATGINNMTGALDPVPVDLAQLNGVIFQLAPAADNTSANVTLNLNGLGVLPVRNLDDTSLLPGQLRLGARHWLVYRPQTGALDAAYLLLTPAMPRADHAMQTFYTSGTFTVGANVRWLEVEVIGAGGGAGGSARDNCLAAGGGAGGYARGIYQVTPASTITVTIGAGGAGGVAAADGNDGGASSFGALLSATGGKLGSGSNRAAANQGMASGGGGQGVGGALNLLGGAGGVGYDAGAVVPAATAMGGTSFFGGGGTSSVGALTTLMDGQALGSGGAGGIKVASLGNVTGGRGANGAVIVRVLP